MSSFSRTSSRLIRAASASAASDSRSLGRLIWSRLASTPSTLPNCWISSAAVFGPMPRTPGTLSTASPINASTSPSCSGGTPNFSITAARSSRTFFIVSSMSMPGPINCIKSLSDDTMVTSNPARDAAQA